MLPNFNDILFELPPQLGGTVGDIEGMPYIEAFRQFQFRVGKDNFCVVHVSLIPEVWPVVILQNNSKKLLFKSLLLMGVVNKCTCKINSIFAKQTVLAIVPFKI